MNKTMVEENAKLGKRIAFSLSSMSRACAVIIMGYLSYYATNMLGMSPVLVGNLLLASKLFDGFTDLIMGAVIDKTNTKWGKARPYELAIIGIWLCTWLMFSCPELTGIGQTVWLFCTFALANSLFVTILGSTESVYYARAFRTEDARNKAVAITGLLITVGAGIISIIFPILMESFGTTRSGWSAMVAIFAVPLTVLGLGRMVFVPEVVKGKKEDVQKLNLKSFLKVLKSGPFIYILALAILCNNIVTYFSTSVTVYYFQYIVNDVGKMSLVNMVAVVSPLVLLFTPMVLKKVTTKQMAVFFAALGAAGSFARYFVGNNITLLIITGLFCSLGAMPISYFGVSTMTIDCMDYHEWKTGERIEGVLGAIGGVTGKIGQALGAWLVGFLMQLTHYDGTLAVQLPEADHMIVALFSTIPGIVFVIMVVLMLFYTLDRKMPQIKKELAERKLQTI